ncbi:hypothetical protein TNCV_1891741 [Trichonephila clavipes]|nr:hypothetical protein TNCV_1891741 [Trichonephila clavipes]
MMLHIILTLPQCPVLAIRIFLCLSFFVRLSNAENNIGNRNQVNIRVQEDNASVQVVIRLNEQEEIRTPGCYSIKINKLFSVGYVKSLVYADKPQTLDHLEDNIRRVIADIRPQMLEKVIENWTSRLDYIRASRGCHMPEIIFKMYRIVACLPHEFEPSTTKDPPCRAAMHVKSVESSNVLPWCGGNYERGASSGVVHVTDHGSKLCGPSPKSPRAAELCDVTIQLINQSSKY